VIVTPDRYETIGKTIGLLREQKVLDQLELVIVAPSRDIVDGHESELEGFRRTRVVEIGRVGSVAQANAAGAREASSPVVAFIEGHAYPEPGWAEALIRAHRQPCAVVGPVVSNANPQSLISRTEMLIGYGPWMDPAPGGTVAHLPGHNSSYKRDILLSYGEDLEILLAAETVMHWDLKAGGYKLCLEPSARISHLNASRFSSTLRERLNSGRLFAAVRARDWSPLRRAIYVGGAPLIPLVRFPRIVGQLRRSGGLEGWSPGMLALVLLELGVSAWGEALGYLLGRGRAQEKALDLQFHRERHINARDLRRMEL
jgi:hypothetical protein